MAMSRRRTVAGSTSRCSACSKCAVRERCTLKTAGSGARARSRSTSVMIRGKTTSNSLYPVKPRSARRTPTQNGTVPRHGGE
eukprot:5325756-Lingulodinium_polyedra.AAC.1